MPAKSITNVITSETMLKYDIEDGIKLITQNSQGRKLVLKELFDMLSALSNAAFFLWDTRKKCFVHISDNAKVLGDYSPSLFTKQPNVIFPFLSIHPKEIKAANLINEKGIKYMCDHFDDKSIINMSYCCKKEGSYFQVLLQAIAVERDNTGTPLLFLCRANDITHIKKKCCDLVIKTVKNIAIWNYNFDKELLEEITSLSLQEKKILQLLSRGDDSKEIAKLLFISPHTVDTHRRNLLKKTNCLNTTGLITYAKMIGLLTVTGLIGLSNFNC